MSTVNLFKWTTLIILAAMFGALGFISKAQADHQVELGGTTAPVNCYWADGVAWPFNVGRIGGPLPRGGWSTIDDALDVTNPVSCGSYKINNPGHTVIIEQYNNQDIEIIAHAPDDTAVLSWTPPTHNTDGTIFESPNDHTGYEILHGVDGVNFLT